MHFLTLEMAHKMGLFEEEKEYLRLVNFQAYQGVPFRAAKTMLKDRNGRTVILRNVMQENLEKFSVISGSSRKSLISAIETYQTGLSIGS